MSEKELKVQKTIYWVFPEFMKEFAKQKKVGEVVSSKTAVLKYEDNKTEWYLRIFPNGSIEHDKGNLSLFLNLRSAKKDNFLAKYNFGVVKKSGEVVNLRSLEYEGNEFAKLVKDGLGWGYVRLISHVELELSGCFSADHKLKIMCQLSLYADKLKKTSYGHSVYKEVFDDEVLCDFELKMNDGVTLKAHKAFLVARSPVFRRMLTTDMKEAATSSVDVPDFDSKTMRELLRFMYCVDFEKLEEIANVLIYAAEKYQITELKALCFDQIIAKLSKRNVLDALIIADRVSDSEKLLQKCIDIVSVGNLEELSTSPKWKQLSANIFSKILIEVVDYRSEVIYV